MKRNTTAVVKFKKLSKALGLPSYAVAGILELLWHMTAREAPRGDIGKLSNEDIALGIEWEGDPDELIKALIETRWLDSHPRYRLLVHDWSEHADDATKKSLTRNGLTFCDKEVNVATNPDLSGNVATNPDLSRLPGAEPEPGTSQATTTPLPPAFSETSAPPGDLPEVVVAVATESPPVFRLDLAVAELYELYPPDRRGQSPSRDREWIKSCLMGSGIRSPEDHFREVRAGVERLLKCLESGYDRQFIPGFAKFFDPANGQWRDEWLPIEGSGSTSPPPAGPRFPMFNPAGQEFYVAPDEIEKLLEEGWTRDDPKRCTKSRAPAMALGDG